MCSTLFATACLSICNAGKCIYVRGRHWGVLPITFPVYKICLHVSRRALFGFIRLCSLLCHESAHKALFFTRREGKLQHSVVSNACVRSLLSNLASCSCYVHCSTHTKRFHSAIHSRQLMCCCRGHKTRSFGHVPFRPGTRRIHPFHITHQKIRRRRCASPAVTCGTVSTAVHSPTHPSWLRVTEARASHDSRRAGERY